ncbi:MAG TPA: outer membrane beta-barrel protein [Xanthobacteraceae bacterium]|jgi:outer membrane immunogenic protein
MKRRSETIGKTFNFRAFSAHTRRFGASIYVRAGRIAVVAILLSLITAMRATAADMPLPGPAPIPPNSYYPATAPLNWGGIYFGVNGGYAFGNSDWNNAGFSTGSFATSGGLAGGTAGINFGGFGGFVFGVEGDLDWSGLKGSSSTAACVGLGAAVGTTCQTTSGWLSTARLRAGYAFDRVLVFGTAGAAISDFRAGLLPQGTFITLGPQIGWTAGGGLEYAFTENWTAKVEYLYVGLGTAQCPSGTVCSLVNPAGVSNPSMTLNENIVRAGVNYRFSW